MFEHFTVSDWTNLALLLAMFVGAPVLGIWLLVAGWMERRRDEPSAFHARYSANMARAWRESQAQELAERERAGSPNWGPRGETDL
jgi:hypothetical protein